MPISNDPGPALLAAQILPDGRILELTFAVSPAPAVSTMPDARQSLGSPTLSNGAPLLYLGCVSSRSTILPISGDNSFVGTTGGLLPVGKYFAALVIRNTGGVVVGVTDTAFLQIKVLGEKPVATFNGGAAFPYGYSLEWYLCPADTGAAAMALYATQTFGTGTGQILSTIASPQSFASATWQNAGQLLSSQVVPTLIWTAKYLITDEAQLFTLGESGPTVSAPAGTLADIHGNLSGSFTAMPVVNNSLVDATGFSSPLLSPPPNATPLASPPVQGDGTGVTFFVSDAHGSDVGATAATAQNVLTPCKTVTKAFSLLYSFIGTGTDGRFSKPSWPSVQLLRGDTFANETNLQLKLSGFSRTQPFLLESYWYPYAGGTDPGTRPIISSASHGLFCNGGGSSLAYLNNVVIRGVEITNPSTTNAAGVTGLAATIQTNDLLVDDCKFSGWSVNLSFDCQGGPPSGTSPLAGQCDMSRRITVLRTILVDANDSSSAHSQGLYVSDASEILISQCTLDQNGWKNGAHTASDIFSHNTYIAFHNRPFLAWGTLFRKGGSHGLQGRPGGVIAYDVFSGNAIGSFLDYCGGRVYRCIFEHARDISGGAVRGQGFIANSQPGYPQYWSVSPPGIAVEETLFVHSNSTTANTVPQAITIAQVADSPIQHAVVWSDTVTDWGCPLTFSGSWPDNGATLDSSHSVYDGGATQAALNYAVSPAPGNVFWYGSDYNVVYSGRLVSGTVKPMQLSGAAVTLATYQITLPSETHSATTAPTYVAPTADLGSYAATLGLGITTEADFITFLRNRQWRVWSAAYAIVNVWPYYAASYALRTATVTTSPGTFVGAAAAAGSSQTITAGAVPFHPRRPTARMLPNTVTSQSAVYTADSAGGRTWILGGASAPTRCSVQPTTARDLPDHMRENGVTYHTVYFADDPALPVHSQITWTDPYPAKIFNVIGASRDLTSVNTLWAVDCEERPVT